MFVIFSALGITIMDSFYLLLGYFAYDNKSFIEKALRHYSNSINNYNSNSYFFILYL